MTSSSHTGLMIFFSDLRQMHVPSEECLVFRDIPRSASLVFTNRAKMNQSLFVGARGRKMYTRHPPRARSFHNLP